MIFYDASEQSTKLPDNVISSGIKMNCLEAVTGSDFMIVPKLGTYGKIKHLQNNGKNFVEIAKELDMQLQDIIAAVSESEEDIILKWCLAGAILVQRKSDFDFMGSIGPRLNSSIARMVNVATKTYQRIVLTTGNFEKRGDDLYINGRKANYKWAQYFSAKSSIKYKGALYVNIESDNDILEWAELQASQILKYEKEDVKWIVPTTYFPPDMPDIDDPLQLMRSVEDARLCLVNVPGWGIGKVNLLHDYVRDKLGFADSYFHPSVVQLFDYATNEDTAKELNGIGKKLIENAREYYYYGKDEK